MRERFVSESIKPAAGTFDAARMATGEPGLPGEFTWRKRTIVVAAVLRTWREARDCTHGSDEHYVWKHWFEVAAASGETMKLYFERQPRRGQKGARWWLYSLLEPDETRS